MAETDSVAGISLDLEINPIDLSGTVQEVSERVRSEFQQAFQEVADSIENSTGEIQEAINDIDVDIDSDNIEQTAEHIEDVVSEASESIENSSRTSTSEIKEDVKKVKKESQSAAQAISKKFKMSLTDIKSGFDMVLGSIRSIISNSKGLMSIYQTQIEAEARLGATMRNSTGATEEQIQSVKDLASELQGLGVIGDEVQLAGAQELATYVSTTESIKSMLPVLDNMIAQQYGYSASTDSAVTIATMLGKVLQGQTSALSRYGYSFTKAQEKILKYGTEQERVATLAEVVNESVSGVNEALADTPTGKVKQLSNDFGDLQETLGSIITNVFSPIAKLLDKIIIKLNTALSLANQYVKQMLGIQDSNISLGGLAEDADETTDAVDDTTDSVKKLKKATAGFDQLNILSSDKLDDTTTDGSSESLAVDIDTSAAENSADELGSVFDKIKQKFHDFLNSIGLENTFQNIRQKVSAFAADITASVQNGFSKLISFFQNLWNIISTSFDSSAESLQTSFGGLLESITDLIGEALVIIADAFDIAATDLDDWVKENEDTIKTTFDSIFSIIDDTISVIRDIIQDVFDMLTNWWESEGKKLWDTLCKAILDIVTLVLEVFNKWVKPVWDALVKIVRSFWYDCLKPILEKLLKAISKLWNDIIYPLWENLLKPLCNWLIDILAPAIKFLADMIASICQTIFQTIGGFVGGILDALNGLIDFLSGAFTGNWEKAWQGICEFSRGIIESIYQVFKGFINLIIDALNTLWGAVYHVVKGVVDSVGDIAGALGDLFGQDWHFNMPEQPPLIPKLAKGGLATSPTLALVGDNKNAKSDPEVIAPLSKLKQMIVPPTIKALSGNGNYNSESSIKEKNSNNSEIIMMLNKMYELIRNQEEQYINNIYLDSEKIESKSVKIRKRKARRYNNV